MNTRCLVPLLLAPFLVGTLFAQSEQKSVPRPESFEWDHQMALFEEAFNNQNFVEAERYGRRSLEIVDQLQLGDGKRATSLSSTAQALRHQKKFAESEPLFRQALALREKVLPPNHPRTASTLEGLAVSLVGLQRLDEAGPYYLRALAIWDRAGDDEEPCPHGKVLDGLGRIYFRQGKLDQAEPLYQRAISIWIAAKEKCSVIVPAMNDLAALYWARGDTSKAEAMYLRTIPMLQRELGDDQPELVARQQANLARVYVAQKKFSESIPLLESADERRKNIVDEQIARGNSSPTK